MKTFRYLQWGSIDPALLKHRLSASHRFFVGASLTGVLLWSFAPHSAAAQAEPGYQPFEFEVNNFPGAGDLVIPLFPREYFSNSYTNESTAALVPDPRAEKMREYLASKNSPLTNYTDILLEQDNYRLIIGISFAESNFCKRNIRPHNCWGIGGAYPESYAD